MMSQGSTDDRLSHLKRSRSAYKAHLTKKEQELTLLMDTSDNVDSVNEKLTDVAACWHKFADAHAMVVAHLTDDIELGEAETYLGAVSTIFEDIQVRANKWIETALYTAVDKLDSVSQAGSRNSRASNTSSAMRQKLVEESANRKALEVKFKLLEEQQTLIEKRMQLQMQREKEEFMIKQQERMLEIKTDLAQAKAREQVYADAIETECPETDSTFTERADGRKKKRYQKQDQYVQPASNLNPYANIWEKTKPQSNAPSFPIFTPESSLMHIIEQQTKCLEHISLRQEQSFQSLTLPKPDVQVFKGEPMEYATFIRAFEDMIEQKTNSNSTRLHFLVQYTAGDVQELMRSCLTMDPNEGYVEARKLLQKRYGQSYRIASSFVEKITKGSTIKPEDSNALQKFSVLLTSCNNTLRNIGYMSKIENPDNLRSVIGRLPFGLRRKWRTQVDRINETEQREILFQDIVEFVEREARTVAHPVFGDILFNKEQHEKKSSQSSKITKTTFVTQTDSKNRDDLAANNNNNHESGSSDSRPSPANNRCCVLCNAREHTLETCTKFKVMSMLDRVEFVRNKGLCFNCLIPRHLAKDCRKWGKCVKCNRKHATLLHPSTTEAKPAVANGAVNSAVVSVVSSTPAGNIGLPIVPVKVKARGRDTCIVTHAFLDGGSNTTFCSDDLRRKLDVHGKKITFSLTTLHNENCETESNVVSLEVYDLDETKYVELPMVFSRPKLPVSFDDIPKQEDVERWPYLDGIHIPRLDAQVDLLIGNDNPTLLEPKEVRSSQNGGPYAVKTMLGWAINGPLGRNSSNFKHKSNFIRSDVKLDRQFRECCDQEFNDSHVLTDKQMSRDDIKAVRLMDESVQYKDGHYELALPFKTSTLCLHDNRPLAEHRLQLLKKRLIKDHELFLKYSSFMTDLLQKGYAEEVPVYQINQDMVWYLPHHPVFHPKKPDKTRVVFDCSATYRDVSLNKELLQGPDMTNSLVGVLLRFRQEPIALTADIEAMFHQVRVQEKHRDVLRFLWWPDGDLNCEPKTYRMNVHLFGAVSSPSVCNYALKKTAEDNISDFEIDTINTVRRNFYVDDCLKSTTDEETAVQLVGQLSDLLLRGGFHLTKWISNSSTVMESILVEERAAECQKYDFDRSLVERALGMHWDIHSDKFKFRISVRERPATLRGILSVMSTIYDPLGFVAPLILPVKLILQELCRQGVGWDDSIKSEYVQRWQRWLFDLPQLEDFSVDRCMKVPSLSQIVKTELHYFSDASEVGYGAVVYLRLVDLENKIHCAFVMGKSRLSPLKMITIPRLELSAATVSIRLSKIMQNELELPITKSVYWTDSTAVLRYIHNKDKRFTTFVSNRLAVIHDGSSADDWRYVSSKSNPADDASRGLSVHDIVGGTRWSMGPGFLWQHDDMWPVIPISIDPTSIDDLEVKKKSCAVVTRQEQCPDVMTSIFERFSSWIKLKKFVCWMLHFKSMLNNRKMEPMSKTKKKSISPITVEEMRTAENEILKCLQRKHFPGELKSLDMDEQLNGSTRQVKKSSSICKLDPVLRGNLLRVRGRLQHSDLSEDAKHQIILPKDSHVTILIIRYFHEISGHSGRGYVLSLLRRRYWIVHANRTVRSVLSRCVDCRRRQGAHGEQKMADLPVDRITARKPPFDCCGVDFFGPFFRKGAVQKLNAMAASLRA